MKLAYKEDPLPKYIAVEGPIGVGKTTLANKLAKSFNYDILLEMPAENPFLEASYKNPTQSALAAQLFFLFQRVQQMEELKQRSLFEPVRVADFILEKDRLFAEVVLSAEEMKLYDKVYEHLTLDSPKPDLVIYLQTPVELLKKRVERRSINYEKTISTEYLEKIAEAYSNFFHFKYNQKLLIVNNENLDIIDDPGAISMLVEKIDQLSSTREFFNPRVI
jgi:deoxyguanosine kinase